MASIPRQTGPCESCRSGRTNLCDHITVGHVSPGLQTGFCRDTGGGWGEELVAHRSQLHVVPDGLDDERAVLVEPLACAVQLARRAQVPDGGSVLVSGAGAVGLFATLALMTVLAVRHPEAERVGVLRIATTRGDRLFLSILSAAIIHILWLAVLGAPLLWGATVLAVIWAIGVFRYV